MYSLVALYLACAAVALPIEDTPEVAAAEAGDHIALRPDALHPVNSDVQAPQIATAFLDDAEDVAAAKAAFKAAFDDAAAGGLASLQAPAPVHELPAPAPLVAAPAPAPVVTAAGVAPATILANTALSPFPVNGLGYSGFSYPSYTVGTGYSLSLPTYSYPTYSGLTQALAYPSLPIITAAAAKTE